MYLKIQPANFVASLLVFGRGLSLAFRSPITTRTCGRFQSATEFNEIAQAIENAARSISIKVILGLTLEQLISTAGFYVFCEYRAGRVDAEPDSPVYELLAKTAFSIPGVLESCRNRAASSEDLAAKLREVAVKNEL